MLRSMTGLGRGQAQVAGRALRVEVRSVNHKFLDTRTRLPAGLGALEGRVQALVRTRVDRGRVDVTVALAEGSAPLLNPRVDRGLARAYVESLQALAAELGLPGQLTASDLARLHEVLLSPEPTEDPETLWPGVQAGIEAALADLDAMRAAEGESLGRDLELRLKTIETLRNQLLTRAPTAVATAHQRLRERVATLLEGAALDPARLAQECALLADRADVTEELTRLAAHVEHARRLLAAPEPAGRKLDFLCQELHREANTVASKSADASMLQLVVDLKAEIERIREQVQNLA